MLDAAAGKVQDDLAKCLLPLFEQKKETTRLFQLVISREVERTSEAPLFSPVETESTLFRSNSIASKLMTQYTGIVGIPYLQETFRLPGTPLTSDSSLISEIIQGNQSLEVDPNKPDGSESNQHSIGNLAKRFLETILGSIDNVP